jgi:hypothetical protein
MSILDLNTAAGMLSTKTSLLARNMYLVTGDIQYVFLLQDNSEHFPFKDMLENRELWKTYAYQSRFGNRFRMPDEQLITSMGKSV